MKYLFFIKGDGRGHITQALALTQLLESSGHKVCAYVIGCTDKTRLPNFLFTKATVPIERIYSPNFVPDSRSKGISWSGTILDGFRHVPAYRRSFASIKRIIQNYRPDVIINLFDPALTLYCLRTRQPIPVIHIAHQYLMLHKAFSFPEGRRFEKSVVVNYTRFTRLRTDKMLALSFYEVPDDEKQRIYPIAPLLRSEVYDRTTSVEDHFLVYVLNHGLAEEIQHFNEAHPEIPIHAFWSNKNAPETWEFSKTLTYHQLNDTMFLDKMASCRGIACTAGFETVSEALYFRKPALLMPSPGQYEQFANAFDAEKIGAGKRVSQLDLNLLLEFMPKYKPQHQAYLDWLEVGRVKMMYHLENPTEGGKRRITRRSRAKRSARSEGVG